LIVTWALAYVRAASDGGVPGRWMSRIEERSKRRRPLVVPVLW
jgi:hypothetical protein